jgi:hypothetical protein
VEDSLFNLIQGLECLDGRHTFQISRIYSDDLAKPSTIEEFEVRGRLPTIVMEEGAPSSEGTAHFVKLSDFVLSPKEVSFDMVIDTSAGEFPAELLAKLKAKHGLSDRWSWHHTCWQYGQGNIFESLYKFKDQKMISNQPTLFSLRQPPRIEPDLIACMMPFDRSFDDVYSSIRSSCSGLSLQCLRVDEIYSNGPIIADVIDVIDRAAIVVCDLTGKNPNVLYETGISHAIGREVIILSQDISNDVPFDLSHVRCIQYDGQNQSGRDELRRKLAQTMEAVLGGRRA